MENKLNKKQQEDLLDMKIWEGCHKWAKAAWKNEWIYQIDWDGEDELASSIHGFICKQLKIGVFKKK